MTAFGPKPEWRPSSGGIRIWGNSGLAGHRVRMAALDPRPSFRFGSVAKYFRRLGPATLRFWSATLDIGGPVTAENPCWWSPARTHRYADAMGRTQMQRSP